MHRVRIAAALASLLVSGIASAQFTLTPVMNPNERAVQIATAPRDPDTQYLVEQRGWGTSTIGKIRAFSRSSGALLGTVLTVPDMTAWNEGGLLGMAFHPEFGQMGSPNSRKFYIFVTAVQPDTTFASELREYEMVPGSTILADAATANVLLKFPQTTQFHKGGTLRFGEDGLLYIGVGDGALFGVPQDLGQYYGKILRLDVNGDDFPADPLRDYKIPASNPFVGVPSALGEIFARGLRNPWKWSFDRTADNGFGGMFIGDVGQDSREEANYIAPGTSGQNFGWSNWEGRLNAQTGQPDPMPANLTGPFLDYGREVGVSIAGGVVYRGTDLGTSFYGHYIFADTMFRWISWQPMNFDLETGALLTSVPTILALSSTPSQANTGQITSIDPDSRGELWLSTYNGRSLKVTRTAGVSRSASGTITLGNAAGPYLPVGVNVEIRMNANPLDVITLQVGLSPTGTFKIPVPTGAGTLSVDHGSWLKRVVAFDSTSVNVTGLSLSLTNGDVDRSGEVDAADIDSVIASFGLAYGDPSYVAGRDNDVDRSGEVDAADIDIVIANFGATDD